VRIRRTDVIGSSRPVATSGLTALVPRLAEDLVATQPGRVYREVLAIVERPLIAHVLALTGGNQLRAARLLGLNRNTLRRRCRELGLSPQIGEAFRPPSVPAATSDGSPPARAGRGPLPADPHPVDPGTP
jgi:DNA-binding protein Fis